MASIPIQTPLCFRIPSACVYSKPFEKRVLSFRHTHLALRTPFPDPKLARKNGFKRFASEKEPSVAEENVSVETSLSEEEQDEKDIADVLKILSLLKKYRDMTFEETRLTVMIEDPREAERRLELGIENESGCSREELAEALTQVFNGQKPKDTLSLRTLAEEMRNWPNLDETELEIQASKPRVSLYAKLTDTGVDPTLAAKKARLSRKDQWDDATSFEAEEEKKDLGQILPPWMGYSLIYGVSVIPIFIGIAVVVILFLNSLQ